jgi:hypothetical protein
MGSGEDSIEDGVGDGCLAQVLVPESDRLLGALQDEGSPIRSPRLQYCSRPAGTASEEWP